jgi:hypothetical protein
MKSELHSPDVAPAEPSADIKGQPVRLSGLMAWLFGVGIGAAVVGVSLDLFLRFSGSTLKPVISVKDLLFPNAETNLFSWFSATVLAAVAIGFAAHAVTVKRGDPRFWSFVVLSATALLLSADEAAMLHERLAGLASWLGLSISWGYQWIIVGVPVAILAGLVLLRLARSLDPVLRNRLVMAGFVFLLGAIGGEVLGGMITKLEVGFSNDISYLVHSGAILVEEALEVCGAILALRAVLMHFRLRRAGKALFLESIWLPQALSR